MTFVFLHIIVKQKAISAIVAHNLEVLKHFYSWDIFCSGSIETFWAQKQTKKCYNSQRFWTTSNLHV